MKNTVIPIKSVILTILIAAAAIFSTAPTARVYADKGNEGQSDKTIYNVVPRIPWSASRNQSWMYSFTFGDNIHTFKFDPINIEKMEYLEFDIYIPDPEVVYKWKTGETEFEITSSGTCDVHEYAWSGFDLWKEAAANGLSLQEGWNHVKLKLPKNSAADFSRINYIRWYWNDTGSNRKMPGCRVANLKFSTANGKDPTNAHLKPFIPAAIFDTEDVPVALANVTWDPYNADPTGEKDSTKAIQDALNDVSLNGGGTVWMPAGKYRVTGQIRIPAYVTLRGDWSDPEFSDKYGTIIALDIPAADRSDTGTFILGGSGGVYGLTVYYSNQSISDVKAYPFTFYVDGHDSDSFLMPSAVNCTILNGYRGIGATTKNVAHPEKDDSGHENMSIINFRGTFLSVGAESYNESDFGFWDDVKISSKYWLDASRAGLLEPVEEGALIRYTKEHTTGIILGDLEWESLNNITIDSCAVGIHTVHGKRNYTDFQGLLYDITTKDCGKGLVVDALCTDNGMLLANSSLDGGLYNHTSTVIRMFNVKVNGAKEGRLREDADFSLDLPIPDTDHGYMKPNAILYTADMDISGTKDISAELQMLLDRAGTTGGVVYLPGGIYRLDAPVKVPAGVELKGTSAVPTKDFPYEYGYNGTTLLSYYTGSGPDDQALITLNGKGAGLNGIRINYPENHSHKITMDKNLFATSYAVKGAAPYVYIVNSYITSSAYGVDFTGCDYHYIKGFAACCYRNTLKLGGKGGVLSHSFQNPYMFYVTADPYVMLPQGKKEIELYEYLTRDYSDYLILENASGELIYNIAAVTAHTMITNHDSIDTTVINLSSDYLKGIQIIMNGGSMTVVNAMRWSEDVPFLHEKGFLRIYNRFEHCFSSGLDGDAVEDSYVVWK